MPNRTTNATRTHPTATTTTPTNTTTPPTLLSATPAHKAATDLRRRFIWRLPDFWSQTINARSRRRRRRPQLVVANDDDHDQVSAMPAPPTTPASHIQHSNSSSSSSAANKFSSVTRSKRPAAAFSFFSAAAARLSLSQSTSSATAAYLAATLILLSTTCSLCASASASPCESHSWWDPVKDKCIPCTVCQGEMIPLRPCQLHRDTICGSIYDLKIDWVVLAKTEPNWKERRKSPENEYNMEQHFTHEELQQYHEETVPLDWQTAALFLAVLACLLFFIVAACILIHHMRQWRRMERRLDQDVEELSTKLMAKLAEVQSLEGGTFFIGNADALRVPTTFQPQHVLLPEKPAKHHDRRILKTIQPGNVYIEENSSKG